jgi:hypothetical protein
MWHAVSRQTTPSMPYEKERETEKICTEDIAIWQKVPNGKKNGSPQASLRTTPGRERLYGDGSVNLLPSLPEGFLQNADSTAKRLTIQKPTSGGSSRFPQAQMGTTPCKTLVSCICKTVGTLDSMARPGRASFFSSPRRHNISWTLWKSRCTGLSGGSALLPDPGAVR